MIFRRLFSPVLALACAVSPCVSAQEGGVGDIEVVGTVGERSLTVTFTKTARLCE